MVTTTATALSLLTHRIAVAVLARAKQRSHVHYPRGMSETPFADLASRMTPEALDLFREMAAAHIESTGDRRFMRSGSMGMGGSRLTFTGDGTSRRFQQVDVGAIEDICSWGLLHVSYGSRGTPTYRVTGEALRFYRWLMESQGAAIDQVEASVQRTVESSAFAEAHPGAAHHLNEAFALLWAERTSDQIVSEIGDHLRKALMDATTDIVGQGGSQERPVERLRAHMATLSLSSREADVVARIVDLAEAVLRLDHRLNHVRDEADRGRGQVGWDEMRRAAFATALACYELGRLKA